jgi:hypothetical protein
MRHDDHDYKRNGTTTLFAALETLEGKVVGECHQRHRHQEFLKFPWLSAIVRQLQCVIPPVWFAAARPRYRRSCRFDKWAFVRAPQTVQTLVTETLSLQNHGVSIHCKPFRNCDIRLARRSGKNDPAAQSHLLWGTVRRSPLLELLVLHFRNLTQLPHTPG